MTEPPITPELSILLSVEELLVKKRTVVRSDVRVQVSTVVREILVSEMIAEDRVQVDYVPVGRYVDAVPAIRQEGDTTILSLVEEVIERRLILKEEIHLRRVRTVRKHQETVVLRKEILTVERTSRAAEAGADIVQASNAVYPNH